jgi:peptide-methionine (R)-S-oxide reductase
MTDFKKMTDMEWRERLTAEEFEICIERGTELAFSGKYVDEEAAGTYLCRCCDAPVFHSTNKYHSGSGWASFYQPANSTAVAEAADNSHGMERVETICARCGAHLGHLFTDGPEPTGLRYCTNSLSMSLKKE